MAQGYDQPVQSLDANSSQGLRYSREDLVGNLQDLQFPYKSELFCPFLVDVRRNGLGEGE